MQPYPIRPGTAGPFNGEALTLWRLRRDSTGVRCFVAEWPEGFWFAVECAGGHLLASETLPDIDAVLARSTDVRAALIRDRWLEE